MELKSSRGRHLLILILFLYWIDRSEKRSVDEVNSKAKSSFYSLRDMLEDETQAEEEEETEGNTSRSVANGIIVLDSDPDDSIIIEERISKPTLKEKPATSKAAAAAASKNDLDSLTKNLESIDLNSEKQPPTKKLLKMGKSAKHKKENTPIESPAREITRKPVEQQQEETSNDLDIPFSQRMKQRFENAAMFK
jgi:hypothetical protein